MSSSLRPMLKSNSSQHDHKKHLITQTVEKETCHAPLGIVDHKSSHALATLALAGHKHRSNSR